MTEKHRNPSEGHPPLDPQIGGHLIATTHSNKETKILIQPEGGIAIGIAEDGRYEPIKRDPNRLPTQIPTGSVAYNNRVPLPYEPQGYVNIFPREGANAVLGIAGVRRESYGMDMRGLGGIDMKGLGAMDIEGLGGVAIEREGMLLEEILMAQQAAAPPLGDYFTDKAFNELAEEFKGADGKFLAMTAYGAVPLPDQMLRSIPEKLMSRPVVQEREIFVLKQEEKTRVTERDYTQFEHSFIEVPKALVVEKLDVKEKTKIIEVPHFNYKPVVEDKIVEVPLGIKYVEIPIEVACRMPPKIIPVPKVHIVERIIETTKPVVQEKIIEIPEVVRKKVPKIVIKDIPYVVPKYVEKIIEVPYQPGQTLPAPKGAPMTSLPPPPPLPGEGGEIAGAPSPSLLGYAGGISEGGFTAQAGAAGGFQAGFSPGAAPGFHAGFSPGAAPGFHAGFSPGAAPGFPAGYPPGFAPGFAHGRAGAAPSPLLRPGVTPRAHVKDDVLIVEGGAAEGPQTFYMSQGIRSVELPYEAKIEVSIVQQEDIPKGAAIAQPHIRYMAPGPRAIAVRQKLYSCDSRCILFLFQYNEPDAEPQTERKSLDEPIYAGPMDPIIAHAPPGMRAIEYHTKRIEPEILTQQGVMRYSSFECCLKKDVDKILPNLAPHALVPMDPEGTPNLRNLAFIHSEHAAKISPRLCGITEKEEEK